MVCPAACARRLACANTTGGEPIPLPSKDPCFKAFGPKDPTMEGFWAILMLRDLQECTKTPPQNNCIHCGGGSTALAGAEAETGGGGPGAPPTTSGSKIATKSCRRGKSKEHKVQYPKQTVCDEAEHFLSQPQSGRGLLPCQIQQRAGRRHSKAKEPTGTGRCHGTFLKAGSGSGHGCAPDGNRALNCCGNEPKETVQ